MSRKPTVGARLGPQEGQAALERMAEAARRWTRPTALGLATAAWWWRRAAARNSATG